MKDEGAEDAKTMLRWMDNAITDAADQRLSRTGGNLRFETKLSWIATIDDRGKWYAHYICEVPREQYIPSAPFWAKHVKLRTEAALREHVVKAIAGYTRE